MREAARFLETLSDILDLVTTAGMDSDSLPLLLEAARKDVETVRLADPSAEYEIGDGDVFWRGRALPGTAEWAWRERLLEYGVETLAPPDDPIAFRTWVAGIRGRIVESETPEAVASTPAPPTAPLEPVEPEPSVGPTRAPATAPQTPAAPPPDVSMPRSQPPPDAFALDEEAERIWWLHGEAANRGQVPRRESEDLVERLAQVLQRGPARADGRSLETFDELTTIHVLNVALLTMGVARHLAFDGAEVRALGLAALYHDVGRVRTADTNPGDDPSSEARRSLLRGHPEAGARVLMDSGSWFAVAAVVAYEHHLSWRGTSGYPEVQFARAPHQFSRIVTVCDTYDVLRTERPHRPALSAEAAVEYLRILAGKTLDPEIVTAVVGYSAEEITRVDHPRTRPEAGLSELRWLPDSGFDPDFEPRPISI